MVAFSIAPFAFGTEWGVRFLTFLSSPAQPVIFPVTWAASWGSFGIIAALAWRWAGLYPLRAVFLGAAVPFGATGGFEIVYQLVGDRVQPWGFGMSTVAWVGIVLWTLPGVATAPWWKVGRWFGLLLAIEAIGFVAWASIGYPQVTWGSLTQVPLAYAFNIGLKVGAFLLIAAPTYEGVRRERRAHLPPPNEGRGSPAPDAGGEFSATPSSRVSPSPDGRASGAPPSGPADRSPDGIGEARPRAIGLRSSPRRPGGPSVARASNGPPARFPQGATAPRA